MKSFLALAVLATSVSAFAASNSAVNDLQYLPNAGTFFGDTSYNQISYSDRDFDGTSEVKSETSGYLLRQVIGYALMDNFSVAASLGYSDTKFRSTGSPSMSTTGLNDIDLQAKYRIIDAENRLDILGGVSISPGDSEIKSDGDSNAYTGGHAVNLGAAYGIKKSGYQWSFQGLYTYDFEKTTKDKSATPTEKIKDDAHSELDFVAALLTQVGENCYIKTSAGVNFEQEYDDDDNNTTSGTTSYTMGAEYQHLFSKDLYGRAGVSSILGGSGYSSVVMLYSLGAGYQF